MTTTSFIEYDATGLDINTSNKDAPIRPLTEYNAIISTKVKMPQMVFVHAAALGNIDLINPGIGFDDVNFISGNLYACHLQAITAESMIYKFNGTSLVVDEFSQYLAESGLLLGFQVQLGTSNGKKIFKNVSGLNPVFGINDIVFEESGSASIQNYQGIIDNTSTLATFANAKVDWFWQVAESFTLDGLKVQIGDIIECNNSFSGTPANLYDNFNRYYVLDRGTINASTVLSDFANSTIGMFWTANEHFTIDGIIFQIGDIIKCSTAFTGTPINLIDNFNFFKIPTTNFGTGVISGCALSINLLDNTKVDISTGMYAITDVYSDVDNPITTKIEIVTPITITLTHLADQLVTYLSLDINKNVIQSASAPTPISHRDYAFIGVAVHSNNVIVNAVNNLPTVAIDANAQIQDILNYIGFKTLTGNTLSANGANLLLNKSVGTVFKAGSNFNINRKQPHELTLSEQLGFTFRYRNQNGLEGTDVTLFDPTYYDLNGVTTLVPGANDATIQRIYIFSSGLIRIQRGQVVYPNMDAAITGFASDSFVTETNIAQNGLYLGALIIRKDCTSLLDTTRCKIVNGSGNISGGAANLTNNLVDGLLGSMPYQSATNVTAMLTGNITTGKLFLSQTGTGTESAAPVWSSLNSNDISNAANGLTQNASGVTYTLTAASNPIQRTSGNGVTIYILPDATTLTSNRMFTFSQDSGDSRIQIKNAGNVIIAYVTQGMQLTATCTSNSTANGTWYFTKISRGYINPLGYGINNVALGANTGLALLDGTQNTFIGNSSGYSVVSSGGNTFIGFGSGGSTTGSGNTFVGNTSGNAVTTGAYNTYIGGYTGTGLSTISNAIVLSDGQGNIGFMNRNDTTSVSLGYGSIPLNATGIGNLGIGNGAGHGLSTGGQNALLGVNTGYRLTVGSQNTLLGSSCGGFISGGNNNTVVGYLAANGVIGNGSNNTVVGSTAGYSFTTSNNTLIGSSSGYAITSGAHNTYLGTYTGTGRETESNNVILSDGQANIVAQFSGTIQNANFVLASPNGSAGPASMRALVANDVAAATTGYTTQSADVVLTVSSNKIQVVTGSVNLPSYALPDATTLALNRTFTLINQSTAVGGNNGLGVIKNNSGTTLFNIPIGGIVDAICTDISTSAGVWSFLLTFGSSLSANVSQMGNFALGSQGGASLANGTQNTMIGTRAGKNMTGSSSYNTLVGFQAGSAITTGSNNTALGLGSLSGVTTANNSTSIGFAALNGSTGIGNTAVGYTAGLSITAGAYNTYIGAYTGVGRAGESNNVILSDGQGNIVFTVNGTLSTANLSVGSQSLLNASSNTSNIGIGYNAGNLLSSMISTLGTITPGSGYTNGSYIALMSLSSGTAMTTYPKALITIAGGIVTGCTLYSYGLGGSTTTVLTAASALIGGTGSGFSIPVASITACSSNVILGSNAGGITTYPSNNVILSDGSGNIVLNLNGSVASGSISIGLGALAIPLINGANVAIGNNSMQNNVNGTGNTSIGNGSMQNNTNGTSNIAIGNNSMQNNTSGVRNVGVGSDSLANALTGQRNVAVGFGALKFTTSDNNVAVGYSSGILITAGTFNTFIGSVSGSAITTGSYNTYIGSHTGTGYATSSNNVILSDGQTNIVFMANGITQKFANNAVLRIVNGGASSSAAYSAIGNQVNFTLTASLDTFQFNLLNVPTNTGNRCSSICAYVIGADSYISVGSYSSANIVTYKWNGTAWASIGAGVGTNIPGALCTYVIGADTYLTAMNTYNINTVATYKWNGTTWVSIGAGISVPATAGGICAYVIGVDSYLSVTSAVNATFSTYKWDGTTWVSIGAAIAAGVGAASICAFAIGADSYLAISNFNVQNNQLYKWDGTTWVSLGLFAAGTGPIGIYSFVIGSDTYLASAASSNQFIHIYKWNGTTFTAHSTLTTGLFPSIIKTLVIGSDTYLVSLNSTSQTISIYKWNGTVFIYKGDVGTGLAQSLNGLAVLTIGANSYIMISDYNAYSVTTYTNIDAPINILGLPRAAVNQTLVQTLCFGGTVPITGVISSSGTSIALYNSGTGVPINYSDLLNKTFTISGSYNTI